MGALLALVLTPSGSHAETARRVTREYDLKAAFLFNFTHFVQWPDSAFATPDAPFVIGLLGEDPFGSGLVQMVANESVGAHRIVVEHCAAVADAAPCHLVFVSRSGAARVRDIVAAFGDRNMLTVGETDDFARDGGMIGLVVERAHLRVQINPAAIRAARLTVSSQLMRQAELVQGER